jgi:RNA polymerase sigma factor (sigma-70 family)
MSPQPVAVYVVDDDASFRTATGRLLRSCGYRVNCYETANQALKNIQNGEPGCILLDVQMPGLNGMQFQERLAKMQCILPIVFITGHGDIETSVKAIKAGAEDFLIKPVSKKVLLEAVARALERSADQLQQFRKNNSLRALFSTLTEQEREVFALVVRGHPNKQIARKLGTSIRTVKARRHNTMNKLKAKSVAALVSIAVDLKLTVA